MADVGKIAAVITANAAPFEAGMSKAAQAAQSGSSKIQDSLKKIDPAKAFGSSIASKIEDIFKIGGIVGGIQLAGGAVMDAIAASEENAKKLADGIKNVESALNAATAAAVAFQKAQDAIAQSLDSGEAFGRAGRAQTAGASAAAAAQKAVDVALKELGELDARVQGRGLIEQGIAAFNGTDLTDRAKLESKLSLAVFERDKAAAQSGLFGEQSFDRTRRSILGQANGLGGEQSVKGVEAQIKRLDELRKMSRDAAEQFDVIGSEGARTLNAELDAINAKLQKQLEFERLLVAADEEKARLVKAAAEDRERERFFAAEDAAAAEATFAEQEAAVKRLADIEARSRDEAKDFRGKLLADQQARFDATAPGGAAGITTRGSADDVSARARFERLGAAMPQRQKELDALKRIEKLTKDEVLAIKALDLAKNITVVRF